MIDVSKLTYLNYYQPTRPVYKRWRSLRACDSGKSDNSSNSSQEASWVIASLSCLEFVGKMNTDPDLHDVFLAAERSNKAILRTPKCLLHRIFRIRKAQVAIIQLAEETNRGIQSSVFWSDRTRTLGKM